MLEFQLRNHSKSGIAIFDVKGWFTDAEVVTLKGSYPSKSTDKIVVFNSSNSADFFPLDPEYSKYYQSQPALRRLGNNMRNGILDTLPEGTRRFYEKKRWTVSVQMTERDSPVAFDQIFHVHRHQVIGSLTLVGVEAGTVVRTVEGSDLAQLDFRQIYELHKAGRDLSGTEYRTKAGEFVVINGVHFQEGGLHAAPSDNGTFPPRFSVFVGIHE